ncbi:MAG: sodium-dependent transporter [Gammaproteobacteria bacterium]|nr:sodium-dependent transporter [Gammaproteobacteria bacterium]
MAESSGSTERRMSMHGQWSSRLAFILAVAGSAVGLGNIWKFPYVAGQNGGGAFVLVYLLCVFVVGLPIMMSEVLLGRRGRRNPMSTMRILGQEESGNRHWQLIGVGGLLASFLILSYYSVIGGWTLHYVVLAARDTFIDANAEILQSEFNGLVSSVGNLTFWHSVFMGLTAVVVARGVEQGLEAAVRFLVPALVAIMVGLLVYAITSGDFAAGLRFLFEPDFSKLTPTALLIAMGQAFFSLSVGMGAVMAYGAYLPQEESIINTSIAVVSADTAIALLAGLVIFPIVFANGLDPAEGPGLVFQTLPLALGQMPGGSLVGTLFFLLLAFAGLTSAISLLEPVVAWLVETRGMRRGSAGLLAAFGVWLLGFFTVVSFNVAADFKFLRGTFFDNIDFLTSNILLPMGGFFVTVFAGWVMCPNSSADELDPTAGTIYKIWRVLARFVVPVAVALVFLNAIGVFS